MTRHAFVTGGTGFIGTNLMKLLAKDGWQVTALYRSHPVCSVPDKRAVQWVKGEITNDESLLRAIPEDTDVVFHLAGDTNLWARQNEAQTTVNVQGTQNIIAAASHHNVDVFVHTSSVAAWGNVSGAVTEQHEQKGGSSWINYERTKWLSERKALDGLKTGMRVVILNPANVIGPHDRNNWGRLFLALHNHRLPFIADGCISVAHVHDVARAHITAVSNGRAGQRYILGGRHHRFSDFMACINEVSSAHNMPVVVPSLLFRSYARLSSAVSRLLNRKPSLTPELAHLMTRKQVKYVSDKAINELDYQIPPMRKSITDCYNWLKSEHIL